jgi:hypothetical protein
MSKFLTIDQFKGVADRVGSLLVMWLVLRGSLSEGDAERYTVIITDFIAAAVALIAAAWGWWVNRDKALVQSAANVVDADGKRTVIVTSPELAAATTETNIVSGKDNKVVKR